MVLKFSIGIFQEIATKMFLQSIKAESIKHSMQGGCKRGPERGVPFKL